MKKLQEMKKMIWGMLPECQVKVINFGERAEIEVNYVLHDGSPYNVLCKPEIILRIESISGIKKNSAWIDKRIIELEKDPCSNLLWEDVLEVVITVIQEYTFHNDSLKRSYLN